jgi:putative nucleotidyltransferase with HDIG domain
MNPDQENVISVDQLQVGVYVYLDVGWMRHPFTFNNFKIRDEDQLNTIRRLGLDQVRWDPLRSDLKPLPKSATTDGEPSSTQIEQIEQLEPVVQAEDDPLLAAKRARIQRLSEHRNRLSQVEAAFQSAANIVRGINKNIHAQPARTFSDASQLIEQVVDSLLAAPELTIQLMSEKPGNEDVYFHSLNVAVLSMTLGRELKLPAEIVRTIGLGALFHDIGLNEIPAKILNNPGPLSKAEREFREMHCHYGVEIAKKASLPSSVQKIIQQHHELFDGTGYPVGLKGEAIDTLARLVGLINAYDNLCNPVGNASGMTPHEALSYMFAQHRTRFDPRFLQAFIRFMGVYPPGSVVGLSNDALGLVIRVNSSRPLRPSIIVYDAGIPKSEAIILDLEEEPDINITRAIKPAQLPAAVYDYLSPRRRVSYYFDGASAA